MLRVAYHPELYCHPLPSGHRFPMEKYNLLPEQLVYEGTISPSAFFIPGNLQDQDILRVHDEYYWKRLKNNELTASETRKTGFPHSPTLIERECVIAQGTIDCCYFAMQHGVAFNIAGGTHHAFTNRGEGFCLLNDIAIGASHMLANGLAKKVLVIDLDVHQGNGTAQIFAHDPRVFTFSMHGEKNYPLHKEKSDLDIGLPDGADDSYYLRVLSQNLPLLFEQNMPDLVFYQAGVDVLATDKLGRLGVSMEGCKQRDKMVLEECKQNNVPLVVSMGGGYSERVATIVEAHANTYRLAQALYF